MVASKGCFGVSFDCRGVRAAEDPVSTWREEFFAYGRSSDRRDTRNRYRFIGVERDEDTGLCMTGPRTYDPVTGRFLQGDPVVGGAPYVYSRGNPVSRKDGNGYDDEPVSTYDREDPILVTGDPISDSASPEVGSAPGATDEPPLMATTPGIGPVGDVPIGPPILGPEPTLVPPGPRVLPPIPVAPVITELIKDALIFGAQGALVIIGVLIPNTTQEPWQDAHNPDTGEPFASEAEYRAWKWSQDAEGPGLEDELEAGKKSGKERASDTPSWYDKSNKRRDKESVPAATHRIMDERYGEGNWKDTGPGSEYNKIKKFIERNP
jgi:RHS repeat-associated protein